jgi:hypothetical protein
MPEKVVPTLRRSISRLVWPVTRTRRRCCIATGTAGIARRRTSPRDNSETWNVCKVVGVERYKRGPVDKRLSRNHAVKQFSTPRLFLEGVSRAGVIPKLAN